MIDKTPTPLDMMGLGDEPAIEIEIEDPEAVRIEAGGLEIALVPDEGDDFGSNLAESLDESALQTLASDLLDEVDADILSRKDWSDMFVKGLEVLGMKYEDRTEPWSGACGVFSPLLTEAAVRFQSEMIVETFPAQGPVKTKIVGEVDKAKEDAAARVREDMNFTLTDKMVDYRSEHERLLFSLGLVGAAFKKIYNDEHEQRPAAPFVNAEDLILPYGAANIYTAERVTHIMRKTKHEMRRLQEMGFYRDVDLGDPIRTVTDVEKKKAETEGYSLTSDERYQLLEIHTDLVIEGSGDGDRAVPYVVTIERGTQTVLSIYRNWNPDDTRKLKRQHFVQYTYVPGFGAYGLGFIHLIGGYARAGTSLIRQLVDAGSLSNLPGGLKARGLRIKGDDTPIAPGEFRDVDVPSGTVRDNIMSLPYKEPSQVLSVLLERITDEGRRLAGIAELKISDMSGQAPVGTTLAILERQLKTLSAVQARVHDSLRMEFKLLKEIIRDNTPDSYDYEPSGKNRRAKKGDYDIVEVIPVSDPNAATMAQRILQHQAAFQMAASAPQVYNIPYLHRQMLEILGFKNADKIVPIEEDQKPKDPVSENMAFLTGKPTKAFIHQDHEAHIATHMAMLQDPTIMGLLGQSPMAQQMMGAVMSHVAEHVAFGYRAKLEAQLGVPLTAPDAELEPQVEVEISRVVAQAAQQLLKINMANAQQQQAQQQAQQAAQDPRLQLQAQELQQKAEKDRADNELAQKRLAVEAQNKAEDRALKERISQGEQALDAQRIAIDAAQAATPRE